MYFKKIVVVGWLSILLQTGFAATPVDTLSPGHWYKADKNDHTNSAGKYNTLEEVKPSGWSANVMDPWSGGAFDTKRDRLIVWGGGHGDYSGNEVYVYDVNELTWMRLTDPSSDTGGSESGGLYPDGRPRSRHTYDFIQYVPDPVDRFIVLGAGGTYPSSTVSDSRVHAFNFDPNVLDWTSNRSELPHGGNSGSTSAYNPADGSLWYLNTGNSTYLQKYDPVNDQWTVYRPNAPKAMEIYASAAIDPNRNLMVAVGGYGNTPQIYKWDLSNPDAPPVNMVGVTTGDKIIESRDSVGFEYDPVVDKFVAWDGGTQVYLLDPDTWNWESRGAASGNSVSPSSPNGNGTFGRFRYIPSKNVYIVVNRTDEPVYFYKLAPDNGNVQWPNVSISASSTLVDPGASVTLTWSAENVTGCEAFGDWSGGKATSGTATVGPLQQTGTFELRCAGDTSTVSRSVTVEVDGDVGKPQVTDVKAPTESSVVVTFNEGLDAASAELVSNYQITPGGVTISDAQLQTDNATAVLTVSPLTEDQQYQLEINGVTDDANTPNVIESGSTFSFIFNNPVSGSDVPAAYEWDVLNEGKLVYVDRDYVFDNIPIQFVGLNFLRTANDDKFMTATAHVRFTVEDATTVYVANDERNTPLPDWLSTWQPVEGTVRATHSGFQLYARDFNAGDSVELGGNELGNSMYFVMVEEKRVTLTSDDGGGSGGGSSGSGDGGGGSVIIDVNSDGGTGAGTLGGFALLAALFMLWLSPANRRR